MVDNNEVSREAFYSIMQEKIFHLPKLRSGKDYYSDIKYLFENYQDRLEKTLNNERAGEISVICTGILATIEAYNNGLPHRAYNKFKEVMNVLNKSQNQLVLLQKTDFMSPYEEKQNDPLRLYRVRAIDEKRTYKRSEIFHTPYHLHEKVATCRYSISGFPSLYMGTSLALCVEESARNQDNIFIASRFKLNRSTFNNGDVYIKVMDLGIRPQDFLEELDADGNYIPNLKHDAGLIKRYSYWYPLIAACSFIRKSKRDPFSPEYIIPQLLMQWARARYEDSRNQKKLIGIRYFSCSSLESADLGFNYVFPVSGKDAESLNEYYCSVLTSVISLTQPIVIQKNNLNLKQQEMDIDQDLRRLNE